MKKNIIIPLLLLFVLVSCAPKKYFCYNQGGTLQSDYYSTIPFEWVRNKIIVPVEINGKTYRFILDTGGSNTISEKLQNEFEYATLSKQPIKDQSGKEDTLRIVEMKELTLGGVIFRNVPSIVSSDSNLFLQCFGVDGFIGSNMLRNSIIRFSLPEKNITLTDNSQKLNLNKKQSGKLWLTPYQSNPFFWIDLESGKKGREQLLFDSGMEGLYDLSLKNYCNVFQKRNIFNELGRAFGSNTVGLHGAAENEHHRKLLLPDMLINGMWLKNVVVNTTAASNSRIGAKILEYAIVTLDYLNKRIYFEPLFEGDKDVYEKTFPINPTYRGNKLYVGFVWDEALTSKISVGDRILFIDETDYREVNPCNLLAKKSILSTGDTITLTIENPAGSIHKVLINKK